MPKPVARDCLCLNWAFPVEDLPTLPSPLRYPCHRWRGRDFGFVCAFLFHQEAQPLAAAPGLRLRFPQFSLGLDVLDGDGRPALLLRRALVPLWASPAARLWTGLRAAAARLDFPQPSREPASAEWRWTIAGRKPLEIRARRLGSPLLGEGPPLGPWQATVAYFRGRRRGYQQGPRGLREVACTSPGTAVWPLAVEVEREDLLSAALPTPGRDGWPRPHSTWLYPDIVPATLTETAPERVPLPRRMPVPGALCAAGETRSSWPASARVLRRIQAA